MTWPEALLLFCILSVATLPASLRLLSGHWWRYARVQAYLVALILTFDIAAESRNLWSFPTLLSVHVLGSPIENILFTLATINIFLPLYLYLSRSID